MEGDFFTLDFTLEVCIANWQIQTFEIQSDDYPNPGPAPPLNRTSHSSAFKSQFKDKCGEFG